MSSETFCRESPAHVGVPSRDTYDVCMSNVNDYRKGTAVVVLPACKTRRFGPDFPGWGVENAASFLLEPVAGLTGVVTNVESHGSNPWTKYGVRFADGTTSNGLVEGVDFAWVVK